MIEAKKNFKLGVISVKIGFIGMGAVARVFSEVLCSQDSPPEVYGFDIRYKENQDHFKEIFQGISIRFTDSLKELIDNCDIILSTVTTDVAVKVAKEVLPYLSMDKYYIDMNSMAPERKVEIAELMNGKACFIEAAILGAVGATGGHTKILLSGDSAEKIADVLSGYGLNVSKFGRKVGDSSLFKMIRSVFTKGLETLTIELMVAGRKAEICEEVWNDINKFMSSRPFESICENWVKSHSQAAKRRYFEMQQVVETLENLGVDSYMSDASMKIFKKSMEKGIEDYFTKEPSNVEEVIQFLS